MNKHQGLISYILSSLRAENYIMNDKLFFEDGSDIVCDFSYKGEYGRYSLISGRFKDV